MKYVNFSAMIYIIYLLTDVRQCGIADKETIDEEGGVKAMGLA